MSTHDDEKELMMVVDFILNRADAKKIDVIAAAVERKKQEMSQNFGGLSGLNPEDMAKKMSGAINKSIESSLDGMRQTVRNFAIDIIKQNAPEISEEQMEVLVDSWVPETGFDGKKIKSIAKNGKVAGIPADVLYGMVLQFVSYSIGEMKDTENQELKSSMGNWTEKYWERFPMRIRQEIKRFLTGDITSGDFRRTITRLIS